MGLWVYGFMGLWENKTTAIDYKPFKLKKTKCLLGI